MLQALQAKPTTPTTRYNTNEYTSKGMWKRRAYISSVLFRQQKKLIYLNNLLSTHFISSAFETWNQHAVVVLFLLLCIRSLVNWNCWVWFDALATCTTLYTKRQSYREKRQITACTLSMLCQWKSYTSHNPPGVGLPKRLHKWDTMTHKHKGNGRFYEFLIGSNFRVKLNRYYHRR